MKSWPLLQNPPSTIEFFKLHPLLNYFRINFDLEIGEFQKALAQRAPLNSTRISLEFSEFHLNFTRISLELY